ncbi:hypothetical protein LU298_11465 [Komagataeibacter intermedius]|uniref:Pectate lyase superfamily protein domain-containing protein n=2 Tax=Komagataeibacter intermedius TaxID=66229 RepID=A0A0N1N5V1_9PROT|nr:hypothetical protein [Komagataeibacter intermedius]KPH86515.1 hypothetical protein GLUCOINTEAF2_0202719 [Komagataeibacter intermedius AF2]MCF3637111.1 hypothetical protein [Komagataeibacter intermedius]GAN88050.1 hypothetical protein Gain_0127_016 [Komagataeibacter intermedius TF2]GBQ69325.1 hypothetical protein AA0521_1447 [Komagataeibacter intermedius NRIC 0521]
MSFPFGNGSFPRWNVNYIPSWDEWQSWWSRKADDGALSNETARAQQAEQKNAAAISAEVARATAAEQANAGNISANAAAISAETARAEAEEASQLSRIRLIPILKDYGAKGDGTTSDQAAIAAAINADVPVLVTAGDYVCDLTDTFASTAQWHAASTGFALIGTERVPFGDVYDDLTLYVGSGHVFSTLQAALTYLEGRSLYADVTVQIADGTYACSQHHFNHPQGARVSIIGNTSAPANVVFNCDASNRQSFLLVDQACAVNIVDGMTINGSGWVSHGVWTADCVGCGVQADAGASVYVGSNVRINKFYYGIRANTGAYVGVSSGVQITEAGDVGVHAFNGGHVECPGISVSLTADTGNSLGNGIMAELGGTISCEGAFCNENANWGICGSSNGVVWALNSNVTASTSYGIMARMGGTVLVSGGDGGKSFVTSGSKQGIRAETGGHVEAIGSVEVYSNGLDGISANGGTIECTGASVTNNGGIGVVARNGGRVYYTSITNSGNTGGATYADSISVVGAAYG